MYNYIVRNKKFLVNVPLIIYWIILFILTSLPTGYAITTSFSDKIDHFGAFGLLGVLLYLNLYFQDKYKLLAEYPSIFTLMIASFYGMMDEIHQIFIPGRSAEFLDWLADFSGVLIAVLLTSFLLKKLKQNDFEKSKLNTGTF